MALSGTGHEVLSPLPGDVERVSTCITPASGGMGKTCHGALYFAQSCCFMEFDIYGFWVWCLFVFSLGGMKVQCVFIIK